MSPLEQLPKIVDDARRQAQRTLECLKQHHRPVLRTREWVLPARDTAASDWIADAVRRANLRDGQARHWRNRLIHGDSLLAMAALLAGNACTPSLRGHVDLIYADSGAADRSKIRLPGMELKPPSTAGEPLSRPDVQASDIASCLAMITPRLVLMRELLSDTGSIYVHLDRHIGQYVKRIMDEVFGNESFVREIAFGTAHAHRYAGPGSSRNDGITETILVYSRSGERSCDSACAVRAGGQASVCDYPHIDPAGGRYRLVPADVPADAPAGDATGDRHYEFLGIRKHWRYSFDTMQALHAKGEIVVSTAGRSLSLKKYLKDARATPITAFWNDLDRVGPASHKGRVDPAQKLEALLRRIICASSPENGLVADFCGSDGTTAAVAEKLGRRWITSDLDNSACMDMRRRLIEQGAKPFLYQAIGDRRTEAANSARNHSFRTHSLSRIALSLYGALPLRVEGEPFRTFGVAVVAGRRILVLVDAPDRLTDDATLRQAITQRDRRPDSWDRVVVLGWHFEPGIGQNLAALDDPRLQVLAIPADLLDRLRTDDDVDRLRGRVRFSSLQHLTLQPVQRRRDGNAEHLHVTLANYALFAPETIDPGENGRHHLHHEMRTEPLASIEYWAVDPDYDGQVFRSVWQDYRGNTANDDDTLRVTTCARFNLPYKSGHRRVCVRAVDVFGLEVEVVQTVPEA